MSVCSDCEEVSPDCQLPGQWIKEREISMFRVILFHDAHNVDIEGELVIQRKDRLPLKYDFVGGNPAST